MLLNSRQNPLKKTRQNKGYYKGYSKDSDQILVIFLPEHVYFTEHS